ncbi:unnamed protein product [Didymodactylos carnosus]|uniref:G-protein coupled receptors family 1 profile domain-containing protein n=1 Tax=Didymodactylos carnosus TaxID=1234261 RepID=A0A815IV74_9BILA|nr:unnamed protein product [Didymodactylos carnosus]CAF1370642.1 unnamed protein product [Didymodactylos carnosus]CAF4133666.1 unnamed protein product [Didymodactylos carnosus]CAF4256769.1 unnamed protein product [Didymodactylos carnosus]
MIITGFILNTLSIITFYQPKCGEVGCGIYLLITSIIGQLSLVVFGIKFLYLLLTQMNNLSTARMNCTVMEFLLKFLPTITHWINAFVSIERTSMVLSGLKFKKKSSKTAAKIIIPLIVTFSFITTIHSLFNYHIINDPRINGRTWCVITFRNKYLEMYNSIINIMHLVTPFTINLSSAFIIVHSSKIKSIAIHSNYISTLHQQINAYKHLIISPIVLVLLTLPTLIFAFLFTCITEIKSWQNYLIIIGYFISFIPQMATFLIYVLPSTTYMDELKHVLHNVFKIHFF